MSDYTPTTEEVRELFTNGISRHLTYAGAEFDRWLAEVKAKEAKAERERIRANILERVQDLSSCTKNDNCEEFGVLIASYIDEWLDGVTF